MSPRRPVATIRTSAIPTLFAVLAAGIAVEGCVEEAHAQPVPPRDAGVHTPPPPPPPPPPRPVPLPPPNTAGVPMMVRPMPAPSLPTPG